MNRNLIYLRSILETISEIEMIKSMEGFDENNFLFERSIEKCIENIGEAAKNISGDVMGDYPQVKWKQIVGFRNRVTHDYLGYDRMFLWNTIENEIPKLKLQIEEILKDIEARG